MENEIIFAIWMGKFCIFLNFFNILLIRISVWKLECLLIRICRIFWRITLVCSCCQFGCESGWRTDGQRLYNTFHFLRYKRNVEAKMDNFYFYFWQLYLYKSLKLYFNFHIFIKIFFLLKKPMPSTIYYMTIRNPAQCRGCSL